ncbi:MAG: hypothetical protein AABW90_02255 [Nanoarchaeota archaeon]
MNINKSVNQKFIYLIIIFVIILIITLGIFYKKSYEKGVEVNVLSLKSSIILGEKYIGEVKIKNKELGVKKVSFQIIGDLKDLAEFEKVIKLNPKEEKNFKVTFNSDSAGVFIGKLLISYDKESKEVISIPIILEVQSRSVWFDSNINLFPFGGNYLPGEKITSEVKIFDLADTNVDDVQIIYYIKDFEGNTLVSDKENIVIDDKFEYSKSLNLPGNLKVGSYVLMNIVNYKVSVGTSSIIFNVVSQKKKTLDDFLILVFFFFGFLVVLSLLFFTYFLFYRDKLLKELHGQYKKELVREKELIRLRETRDYRKLKGPLEKKIYKREIKKVEKSRLKKIKDIYKERLKKYKKIKKKGDKARLKEQLKQWKAKGYDTRVLERDFKMPNVNEIRKKIKQWKAKGYDTNILEKKL